MLLSMCSESLPLITSPRISFSHDLVNDDEDDDKVVVPMEEDEEEECLDHHREDSFLMEVSNPHDDHDDDKECVQFDFSFSESFKYEPSSSAAELFSDGLIRPLQLEEKFVKNTSSLLLPPLSHHPNPTNDHLGSNEASASKEIDKVVIATTTTNTTIDESSEQKHQQANNKSFWKINRSSSVHCDNSYKKSSFWSLPLMLRSNSTGSVSSPRQISKKQNSQKQMKNSSSISASSSSSFYMYQLSQKPPLKRNHGGSYGNGVWTNPVLNVPPPYIATGTANLFGIASFFKEKKNKKTKK